jgi:hypothetical protein
MKIILLLTLVLVVLSCSDLTSGKRFEETSLVLTGLLDENSTVNPENPVYIGRTVDVNGGNLTDLFIDDEDVEYVHLINVTTQDTILLEKYPPDEKGKGVGIVGFIDYQNEMLITSGNTYRIEALVKHLNEWITISAETTVPKPIALNPLNDDSFTFNPEAEFPELSYETANTEHPLRIQTESDEAANMFFQFYCMETFDNALYIIEYPGEDETPEDEEAYEHPVSGFPRKVQFWYAYEPKWLDDEQMFVITDRGYKASFIFYGRYEIQAFSVDENYYQYLYKTNGFMHGGIENGVGYFGSRSGDKIYTKVVE